MAVCTELRVDVRPAWPFRMPRWLGSDGLMRMRRGVLLRLLHVDDEPVLVRVAQPGRDRVLFGAWARNRATASEGIARMRQALGVDQDLRGFYERFRFDRLIGPALRADPTLRVRGRPDPFEALAWAICEQLIEYERAAAIQRRLVRVLGRSCEFSDLRDAPSARRLAAQAPALLASFDLAQSRAVALIRASREVAAGRIDLHGPEPEAGWRRLRAITGIGSWTVQKLGLLGQARLDQLPAGDLAYIKLVGRLRSHGDPWARATEEEVMDYFAPYAPYCGLAGLYALRAGGHIRSPLAA